MAERGWGRLLLLTLACLCLATPASARHKKGPDEVELPDAIFKRLETFEANRLAAADKLFTARKYDAAYPAYKAFVLEFGTSQAVAYAILRKGRCLQHMKKRNAAIQEYQEVLDYFPDTVIFAAPAQFYIGQCHWANGDEGKALAVWASMVKDPEYVKNPLAATALTRLAQGMKKQNKTAEAIAYAWQVAVNFRGQNPESAAKSAAMVVQHYIRTQPDEGKLRAFYTEYGGFDRKKQKVARPETTREYWQEVREWVQEHGHFDAKKEEGLKANYYRYWAQTLEPIFPEWDDLQKNVADFHYAVEKDRGRWFERLDAQFARGDDDSIGRITKWLEYYRDHAGKVTEYYEKLKLDDASNEQLLALVRVLLEEVKNKEMATAVFNRIAFSKMDDRNLERLAKQMGRHGESFVLPVTRAMKDKERAMHALLAYYHRAKNAKKGVPLAQELAKVAKYAADATWMKAEMLQWSGKYAEAIAAYQQVERAPANSWRISECYVALKKIPQAVSTLQEIEGFFEKEAPKAAYRIAQVYRKARMKPQYIAQLRQVLRKYPKTRESSSAHNELEKMGLKIGGGTDAE